MATRARIGIELKNGSVLSVYHHWDGYPEWLGRILKTHYNTRQKVAELIDGGDMSSCWSEERWVDRPNEFGGSYSNKVQEYGPQYYSERGEDTPPRLDADLAEYLLPDNGEEYHYVFRNGEWVCYNMNCYEQKLPEVVEIPSAALAV
jgi:hypothetical protein